MFMLLSHWFLHNAIFYYLHHDVNKKKSQLTYWDVRRCFKTPTWSHNRSKAQTTQTICLYLSYIFFLILFHEVIRDIFILSKIINTIFNYITYNLKNMVYEKTSQSKQCTTSKCETHPPHNYLSCKRHSCLTSFSDSIHIVSYFPSNPENGI